MDRDTASLGLLVLRLGMGGLLFFGHGLPKLARFGERLGSFADPIGLGPQASFLLVLFAEVACAWLVMLGLFTRLAAVPILLFTLVAAFVQHAADPWARREVALLFGVPALALVLTGPGRWSLDARLGLRLGPSPRR
jgi:putative oxidoreductase